MTWTVALAIAVGGAVGAPLRHLIDTRVTGSLSTERARRFPWGLLAVNVTGSLLIGLPTSSPRVPGVSCWQRARAVR